VKFADLAGWTCVLLPLIATSCRGGAGNGPLERRRADLDFSTGDVQGTILWNGAPIDAQNLQGGLFANDPGGAFVWVYSSNYSAANLPPGDHALTLYGGAYCFDPSNKLGETSFTITAQSTTTADFDLTATAGQLHGSVEINGVPLPGAWIVIDTQSQCPIGSSVIFQYGSNLRGFSTDGNGGFSRLLAPADYTASVYGPSGQIGSLSFTILPGQTTDVGAINIPTGALQWSISWGGTPAGTQESNGLLAATSGGPSFWVRAPAGTAPAVSAGPHTLGLFASSCRDATNKLGETIFTVTAGATTSTVFDLSATAGRVTGSIALNGVPFSDARIAFDPQCSNTDFSFGNGDGFSYSSVYPTEANDSLSPTFPVGQDGSFARLLAPGSYTAHVSDSSGRLQSLSFDVTAGQTTSVGNIDIQVGAVQGTVFWNGAPIGTLESVGQRMHVAEPGGLSSQLEGSSYSVATLSPGLHTLGLYTGYCTDLADRIGETAFTVNVGATTTADFELKDTAGKITGSVTANNVPVRTFITTDNSCIQFASDETGRFARLLPPGEFGATFYGPDGQFGTFTFSILAGQTTDVDSVTTPAGTDVSTELSGGMNSVNGMSLEFAQVMTAGNTTVVESGACSPACNPPPTGYEIVGTRYWDLSTTAIFNGPIQVCIHYNFFEVTGDESALRLVHDDGSGFANITTSLDSTLHVICGTASSLSPFAVVQPKRGGACTSGADCGTHFCVDGVCCNSACGSGDPGDCQACSVAAGGTTNGLCTPVSTAHVCRPSAGICDAAEMCDGSSLQCPANTFVLAGAICRESAGACDVAEVCTGASANCPPDGMMAAGTICRASAGACDVAETCSGSAAACPPDSFVAAGMICQPASNACQSPGTCSGAGAVCPGVTSIPGCSLDKTPPVFGNVPGPITAFATSTSGARVTYTKPTATDAVDGARPVTCTPASGSTFPVGKSTVTCTTADRSGNPNSATFTVWVQYQAPTDGTFFLAPIRADGGSIFRIGRPVPVRFKLTGASAGITNLVARLSVTRVSSAIEGTTVDTSDETDDDTDFIFRFRPGVKFYAYRWKTTNQTQGTYQLKADLGDGVAHQVNVSLKGAR